MKVRARIELFAAIDGGRSEPLRGSFRPNHRFAEDWYVIQQVQLRCDESLAPGECAERLVDFIPDGLPALAAGMEWQLFDGPTRAIGSGKVLEVLER